MLADRTNIGFMNTIVTRGNGEGVVFAIGMNTEIGKIAESLQEEQMEISPFQQEVNRFGKLLGIIIVIICILVFVVELFLVLISYNWTIPASSLDELIVAFEIAISLAVSAVPEGLVVVITVVMSIGMRKMADRNALVRNLTAVETLGRVNIICSDKTGTLTKNEMTVVRIFINNKVYKVDGVGYNIIGKILDEDNNVVKMDDYLQKFLEVCMFCNNSNVSVKDEETGETIVVGDPTEISMKILAMKMNLQTKAEK
ncbi:MAG: HAD-IC family P-type ATPase [Promethearchaeota archaeon]